MTSPHLMLNIPYATVHVWVQFSPEHKLDCLVWVLHSFCFLTHEIPNHCSQGHSMETGNSVPDWTWFQSVTINDRQDESMCLKLVFSFLKYDRSYFLSLVVTNTHFLVFTLALARNYCVRLRSSVDEIGDDTPNVILVKMDRSANWWYFL